MKATTQILAFDRTKYRKNWLFFLPACEKNKQASKNSKRLIGEYSMQKMNENLLIYKYNAVF